VDIDLANAYKKKIRDMSCLEEFHCLEKFLPEQRSLDPLLSREGSNHCQKSLYVDNRSLDLFASRIMGRLSLVCLQWEDYRWFIVEEHPHAAPVRFKEMDCKRWSCDQFIFPLFKCEPSAAWKIWRDRKICLCVECAQNLLFY
jgi:hypothetical protein